MATNPLAPEELFKHVGDSAYFHIPRALTFWKEPSDPTLGHIFLPQPLARPMQDADGHALHDPHTHGPVFEAVLAPKTGVGVLDKSLLPFDLVFSKFMFLELVVAVLLVVGFGWLARHIKGGSAPRGKLVNALEALLVFIRDQVARPAIGHHDAEPWLPFLWTVFFFVLGLNLFGMIPWMGSATGSFAVTGTLALCTFVAVVGAGMAKLGPVGFLKAQVPHMDLPGPLGLVLKPLIFVIEVFGLLVKHFVLSVRLLANMLAGHIVLAVLVAFIGVAQGVAWYAVAPASIMGSIALSLLELLVAFLQAFIFTFLSALFIGAAVHPH